MKQFWKLFFTYYRFSLPVMVLAAILVLMGINAILSVALLFTGSLSCGPLGCWTPASTAALALLLPGIVATGIGGIYSDPVLSPAVTIGVNLVFYIVVGFILERVLKQGTTLAKPPRKRRK